MEFHNNLINKIMPVLQTNSNIQSVVIYGSLARNDENVNSDIDLMLLVVNESQMHELFNEIKKIFSKSIYVENRNKIVSYVNNIKIEFSYSESLYKNNFKRNYLGSEIPKDRIIRTILFDKTNNVEKELLNWHQEKNKLTRNDNIDSLINSFIYEFEQASNFHRRADSYRCYFFYNISLHTAIKLFHLFHKTQCHRFNFLPKYIAYEFEMSHLKTNFHELGGMLNLQKLNQKKRSLLNFFYEIIDGKIEKNKFLEIKSTCEFFFERDKLWNFRDISKNVTGIKCGKIFRSGMLAIYPDKEIIEICEKLNIRTIFDLRAPKEVSETSYSDKVLEKLNYIQLPFDPWNQPDEFKRSKYHNGSNVEIAYNFFIHSCKNQIKDFFNILSESEDGVLIHCVSGKDRTGIVVSLLHMLLNIPENLILIDYLASETDTHEDKFNIILKYIKQSGGIEKYLDDCGVFNSTIDLIKNKYKVD